MRRRAATVGSLLIVFTAPLFAHDMFWRLTSYYVKPMTALRMPNSYRADKR